MKVRQIIKIIEKDGWILIRMKATHRQYKHLYKKGLVTVAGNMNKDLALKTQISIFKQAGIENE
jgi:predicted RNA binding protein YcfA (HicA-like mRNA interferase family)